MNTMQIVSRERLSRVESDKLTDFYFLTMIVLCILFILFTEYEAIILFCIVLFTHEADEAPDRKPDHMAAQAVEAQSDEDATWLSMVQPAYYDDAPGDACVYCNPVHPEEARSSRAAQQEAGPSTAGPSNRSPKKKTGKECKHYFCIPCKQGGLCGKEFQAQGRPHFQHYNLQIYRTSYENSIRKIDIKSRLDTSGVMEICSNSQAVYHLNRRKPSVTGSPIYCRGCRQTVANAKGNPWRTWNRTNAIVCSIQCLLAYRNENRPVNEPNEPNEPIRQGRRRKQRRPVRSPMA